MAHLVTALRLAFHEVHLSHGRTYAPERDGQDIRMTGSTVRRWGVGAATVAMTLGPLACGETTSEPGPEDRGTFNAQVSGEGIGATISGNAVFGTAVNSGVTEWTLFLWRGDAFTIFNQFNIISMFRENLERPEAGSYALNDVASGTVTADDFVAAYALSFGAAYGVFFTGSGTLTVETSTAEEITGSFQLSGALDESRSLDIAAPTATVTGTFRAVPGPILVAF